MNDGRTSICGREPDSLARADAGVRAGSLTGVDGRRGSPLGFSVAARAMSIAGFSGARPSSGVAVARSVTGRFDSGALGAFSVIGRDDSGTLSISGRGSATGRAPLGGRREPGACGAPGGFGGLRRPGIISGSSSMGIVFAAGGGGLREGIAPARPGLLPDVVPAPMPGLLPDAAPGLLSSSLRSPPLARLNSDAAESDGLLGVPPPGFADTDAGVVTDAGAVTAPARGLSVVAGGAGSLRSGAGSGSSMSTSMSVTVGGGGSSGPPAATSPGGFTTGTCTGRAGSSTMIASNRSDASRGKSSSAPGICGRRPPGATGSPAAGGTFGP